MLPFSKHMSPQTKTGVSGANDMAVLAAYGIKKGDPAYASESACVAFLMKRYQELIAQKEQSKG